MAFSEGKIEVNSESNTLSYLLNKYNLLIKMIGTIFCLYLVWATYRYFVPAE